MIKKLHDTGRKGWGEIAPIGKNEIHYPNIMLDTKMCPFLKTVEVGEKLSLLAICEVKSLRKESKDKPMEITLDIKKIGEEADMKMTAAVEKAIGPHKELDDEESAEHEAGETKEEEAKEGD